MELSSHNTDFQNSLKQIKFKTFFHNRAEMLDYETLFAGRRVVVFSITNMMSTLSYQHFVSFNSEYNNLKSNGIDEVYAVNSTELMFGPWADKQSKNIRGLANIDKKFIQALSKFYQIKRDLQELAVTWQYITIINDGIPEESWHVPFRAGMPWRAIKHDLWRYRGLSVQDVQQYLSKSLTSTN
jgi:peroxiredoxin